MPSAEEIREHESKYEITAQGAYLGDLRSPTSLGDFVVVSWTDHMKVIERVQRDERERHANELDVAVAKARAEVVTVNLEGDFNYVKGYNDGLVEGDAKGRREGKRIASMRGESDG